MSEAEIATLVPIAAAIGEAWAHERVDDLRASERGIIGAWPGTVREARRRVLARLHARSPESLDAEALQQLAHAAYDAARRSWDRVSEPDPES